MLKIVLEFLRWLFRKPPFRPTRLRAYLRKVEKMNNKAIATIEIDWELSHSDDVIRQDLTIMTQEEGQSSPTDLLTQSLPPDQNTFVFKVPEKTTVYVRIVAYDGTYYSKPLVNQFLCPDLAKPCQPISKGWKILEVENNTPCY